MSLDLAVVIVNYNVRDLLRECLRTVYASTGEVRFAVVVVDNDSTDGSLEMVRTEFPQVKIIHNRENVGYPAANNQGLRALGVLDEADAPRYALLLNPDTEVPPDCFSYFVAYMD
ncbi:MAG: glycosyltransferase, partial [Anaerolineales bacterium]|nr:glycosyltransferase [Anaerolineales bacterium]